MQTVRHIYKSKRLVDIVFSLVILTTLSPLLILILILLKTEQTLRGRPFDPWFYRELRISYGETFTLYKFNIFKYEYIAAEQRLQLLTETKDHEKKDELLLVGWGLKQIYLDEVPQFFNVLIGDMSIVGPRPVNPAVFKTHYTQGDTSKAEVPAGITGPFQIQSIVTGDGTRYDAAYANLYQRGPWYRLLWFDLGVMLRTVLFMSKAEGI